jgi:Ca2+:H+ antiporter
MIRFALTAFAPIAPILGYLTNVGPLWIFGFGLIGIAALANWIRISSDQLARRTGPALGGLLTVSVGSLAELLLGYFVLASGKPEVVRAQIVGSIMGTGLLGLGAAVVAGGLTRDAQHFNRARAGQLSSLLVLVFIALLLPAAAHAVAHRAAEPAADQHLSLVVAILLLCLYGANLVYTLVTHRDVFRSDESGEPADWPLWLCLGALGAATIGVAVLSDQVSGAMTRASSAIGVSQTFLGVVVLALVGTISDVFAAVGFARQNRMGRVMSICIGSSIQAALVIAPALVLLSWIIGQRLSLDFENPLELFSIAATAIVVNSIAGDGETTWFEGVLLLGVYVLLAAGFFFA